MTARDVVLKDWEGAMALEAAKQADSRQRGYAGQRQAEENRLAKALGLEPGEYESFSPGPKHWREMDEFDGGAEFRSVENAIIDAEELGELNVRQVHINRRIEDSKRMGAFVRDALRNVTTMEQVYHLCNMVQVFDDNTRDRQMTITPLWEFVSEAFDAAEHRIREAEEILEHMKDNPRTMAQTTNCLVLALIEHGHVSTNLATSHIDDERWIRMQEALHAGRYHIGPNKWGQQTLFMEVA